MKDRFEELEMETAALMALAAHGIPSDTQEVLMYGSKSRGIAPGGLRKAIKAALSARQRP